MVMGIIFCVRENLSHGEIGVGAVGVVGVVGVVGMASEVVGENI